MVLNVIAELPPAAANVLMDLRRTHAGPVTISPTRHGTFQVLVRDVPGKRPRYLGALHRDGTFNEKHRIPSSQRTLDLTAQALATYENLVKLHRDITLVPKPEGKFKVIIRTSGKNTVYLGTLCSDGTFNEKHRTSTKQKVLLLPPAMARTYEELKARYGEVVLAPGRNGKFTVRTPGNASKSAAHVGILYPDGTFKEKHLISARERSQSLPPKMRAACEDLKALYGAVTLLYASNGSIQVQKYNPSTRRMVSLGTIRTDGTFRSSRMADTSNLTS